MAGKAGQQLSDEQVREYAAYHNAQLPPPEKFDGVVVENVSAVGPVYRWQTDDEAKAAKAAADAAAQAFDDDAALTERVRREAARRGVDVPPVPPVPPEPAPRP